ncbi:hypothetical protein emb_1c0079 [Coriobacteriaceae bacterium EMTCatB1]|nr:hypothetical protein emb_1c0079 [Coriobacteriaceae bacterium EMTCatB1]
MVRLEVRTKGRRSRARMRVFGCITSSRFAELREPDRQPGLARLGGGRPLLAPRGSVRAGSLRWRGHWRRVWRRPSQASIGQARRNAARSTTACRLAVRRPRSFRWLQHSGTQSLPHVRSRPAEASGTEQLPAPG